MAENVRTIHITKALTTSMILHLINEYQNLSEITCAPSVYERTSSKYIDALNELGIKVNKKYNWGAKPRTNGAEFEVLELSNAGLPPKEIAQKLDITLNRVYYLLRKCGADVDNRKRKHDHNQVKLLKDEGLSAKQISQKLDIPVRTVYYILNRK